MITNTDKSKSTCYVRLQSYADFCINYEQQNLNTYFLIQGRQTIQHGQPKPNAWMQPLGSLMKQ